MDEKRFRLLAEATFQHIEAAFDQVDPDVVEAFRSSGVLTLQFGTGLRALLSLQPPLREVWLAAGDKAYHFKYDDGAWVEKHGRSPELLSVVRQLTQAQTGLEVSFQTSS